MGRLREHSHGGIIGDREYSQSLSQGYKGLAHAKTCFLNPHDFANFLHRVSFFQMPKSSEKFGKRGIRLKRGRGCRVGITPPGRPPGCCGWPLLPPTAPPGPVCCLLTPTPPGVPPMPTGPSPPGGIGGGGGGDIEADVPGLKPVGLGGGRGGPVN